MKLYAHPFSSYCQKVLITLYDGALPFDYRHLEDPDASADLGRLWPLKRFPVLEDRGRTVIESTTIIEYLQHREGHRRRWIEDGEAGLEARMLDRVFDNYVMTPMQKIGLDVLRPVDARDPHGVNEARSVLDVIYPWLDARLSGREWAAGDRFGLADCAAAPSLFYADWVHEIPASLANLRAYRARLLQHPPVVRVVDEARPYRHYFPMGAPDRD